MENSQENTGQTEKANVKFSLALKFGLLIILLILFVIVIISGIFLILGTKILKENLAKQGNLHVKNLATSAVEGLSTDDELSVYTTIKDIKKKDNKKKTTEITNVFIIDKKGIVKLHSSIGKVGTKYPPKIWNITLSVTNMSDLKPREFSENGSDFYDFSYPIRLDRYVKGKGIIKVNYGTAHVIYNLSVIKNVIKNAIILILIIAAVILGIGITSAFILASFIVRPIKKITKGAQIIGNGNLTYKIDIQSHDELGILSEQFNIMTDQLNEAQKMMIEQERLKYELNIATHIQKSLLPKEFPDFADIDFGAYYNSAKEVGGDYYDFIKITDEKLGLLIADVSGKGVPGSLVMVMTRSLLRSQARYNMPAYDTLCKTNALIYEDMEPGMFVTALYGIVDVSSLTFDFAVAGHDPLIIYRSAIKSLEVLRPPGFALGVKKDEIFSSVLKGSKIKLNKNDIVITYTDGVLEAMNPQREEYGKERFYEMIKKFGKLSTQEMIDKIVEDVDRFCAGAPQHDDIALIGIKIK